MNKVTVRGLRSTTLAFNSPVSLTPPGAPAQLRTTTSLTRTATAARPLHNWTSSPFCGSTRRLVDRPLSADASEGQRRRQHQGAVAMLNWVRQMVTGKKTAGDGNNVVLNTPMLPADGEGWKPPLEQATFGLGCFWGAERKFWQSKGVYTTSVGYAGGNVPNPTYRGVCSGMTGHAEVVNVVFDSTKTSYAKMLDAFWDSHDPTTKNRQGNDVGTQYRSVIFYYNDEQKQLAERTRDHFNDILKANGRNTCSTEIRPAPQYYLAEDYHQQYLHKNPWGYCGLGGTNLYRPMKE